MNKIQREDSALHLLDTLHEASRALVALEADHLEGLASDCQARSGLPVAIDLQPEFLRREVRLALVLLGRILERTKANLQVLRRLEPCEADRIEYSVTLTRD
jgi:hypothetical protein